jgi:type I restriction enzyme S subunit
VLEPSAEVSAGYFQHLFKSHQYINALRATSDFIRDGQDLNFNNFCGVDLPLIPLQEQAAIARFLVWATNRLDRAIRAKRRIIALLQEQKQAIIHRAVTRGLDPSEPLKDSGIPWLGEIPEHWEVRKIRAVASRVTKGTTPTTLGKQFVASGIRFVKVESISANRNILEWKCAFIDDATDRLLSRSKLRANDVVVSIAGAIGRPAIISPSLLPANTNQAVGIISPLNHLCRSEWLTYVLASPMCLRSLSESSVQTAQANLSLTSLGRAAIGLPHVHEQDMIVARLSIVVSSVANTISRLEREIDLIREYRTRLIADVVTGKLDVREAAAGLPEPDNASDQRLEPEEEEPEFEAEDAQKESTD